MLHFKSVRLKNIDFSYKTDVFGERVVSCKQNDNNKINMHVWKFVFIAVQKVIAKSSIHLEKLYSTPDKQKVLTK